jgi:hypothetical protein
MTHQKILGMIFDDKLQRERHKEHIIIKAIKRFNILINLARPPRCTPYGSATKSIQEKLHHQSLRTAPEGF